VGSGTEDGEPRTEGGCEWMICLILWIDQRIGSRLADGEAGNLFLTDWIEWIGLNGYTFTDERLQDRWDLTKDD
jgi:hypothetical protein